MNKNQSTLVVGQSGYLQMPTLHWKVSGAMLGEEETSSRLPLLEPEARGAARCSATKALASGAVDGALGEQAADGRGEGDEA